MFRLIKAVVLTSSLEDVQGRVRVSSPTIWEESDLLPVVNNKPVNVDDIVWVTYESENPERSIILGKDKSVAPSNAEDGCDILWESVKDDKWTVAFVCADNLTILNSEGTKINVADNKTTIDSEELTINGGGDGGLIKIADLTSKINELVNQFNNHTHTILSAGITVEGSMGPSVNSVPITVPAPSATASTFSKSDYENTKITHG